MTRCHVETAWDGCGGEAEVATAWRRHEVGYSLAHAAGAEGEGSKLDVEAWRDEANELKEATAALGVRRPDGVSA